MEQFELQFAVREIQIDPEYIFDVCEFYISHLMYRGINNYIYAIYLWENM
jgi:hypothetical protein